MAKATIPAIRWLKATTLTIDIRSLVIGDTVLVTGAGGLITKVAISVARDTVLAIGVGDPVIDDIALAVIDGATVWAANSSGSITGPLTQRLRQLSN